MPHASASLPVQVTTREVIIATTEPYIREWVEELKPILRKDIRRVMANPDDIGRYLIRIFQPGQVGQEGRCARRNHGWTIQLRATGRTGQGNRQFDANDQHIVHIVDWLWQYAFDQRASGYTPPSYGGLFLL